jgi:DNA-binding response OmpR family regulator
MNDKQRPVIVVADDDRDICELIQMQLTRHGFQVFITDNGQTALELIDEHHPAVALLDIMMPKLSGLEVVRRIRGNPANSDICIMLISARSSGRIETDDDDLDIADYITKPFSPQDLVKRINDVIINSGSDPGAKP